MFCCRQLTNWTFFVGWIRWKSRYSYFDCNCCNEGRTFSLCTKIAIFYLQFIFQSIRVVKFYWIFTAFRKKNFKNRFNLIRCYFLVSKVAIFHLQFIFQPIRVIKFYWTSIALTKRNFKNRFSLIVYYFFSHLDSTILWNFMKSNLLLHHCTMKCFVRIIGTLFLPLICVTSFYDVSAVPTYLFVNW